VVLESQALETIFTLLLVDLSQWPSLSTSFHSLFILLMNRRTDADTLFHGLEKFFQVLSTLQSQGLVADLATLAPMLAQLVGSPKTTSNSAQVHISKDCQLESESEGVSNLFTQRESALEKWLSLHEVVIYICLVVYYVAVTLCISLDN
jgi:hypothetical protein